MSGSGLEGLGVEPEGILREGSIISRCCSPRARALRHGDLLIWCVLGRRSEPAALV